MYVVMIMTMIVINIHEAKARLSAFVEAAAKGERVVICRRNQPVAELRSVAIARSTPRPVGGSKWSFSVPASFFEPLPDEDLDAFDGADPDVRQTRVAERPEAPHAARRGTRPTYVGRVPRSGPGTGPRKGSK
jgi:prevent-host-death family protein